MGTKEQDFGVSRIYVLNRQDKLRKNNTSRNDRAKIDAVGHSGIFFWLSGIPGELIILKSLFGH